MSVVLPLPLRAEDDPALVLVHRPAERRQDGPALPHQADVGQAQGRHGGGNGSGRHRLLSGARERRWGCLKGASRRELLVNVRKPQHSVGSRPAIRGRRVLFPVAVLLTFLAVAVGPTVGPSGRAAAQTADEDQRAAEKAVRDILKARRQADAAAQAFADAETQVAQTEEDLAKVQAEQEQVQQKTTALRSAVQQLAVLRYVQGAVDTGGLLLGSRVSDQLQADQYAEIAARAGAQDVDAYETSLQDLERSRALLETAKKKSAQAAANFKAQRKNLEKKIAALQKAEAQRQKDAAVRRALGGHRGRAAPAGRGGRGQGGGGGRGASLRPRRLTGVGSRVYVGVRAAVPGGRPVDVRRHVGRATQRRPPPPGCRHDRPTRDAVLAVVDGDIRIRRNGSVATRSGSAASTATRTTTPTSTATGSGAVTPATSSATWVTPATPGAPRTSTSRSTRAAGRPSTRIPRPAPPADDERRRWRTSQAGWPPSSVPAGSGRSGTCPAGPRARRGRS